MLSISDSRRILEGMWSGDLNDLVSSVISIDEYKSKIDEQAVVVGFYVRDYDAAADLNRFIQKSTVDILYSEVSPAPNQQGFYIVFIELMRNTKLSDTICDLVKEVTFLCNVEEWQASIYGVAKNINLSKDELDVALKTSEKAENDQAIEDAQEHKVSIKKKVDVLRQKLDAARKRLSTSALESVEIHNGSLHITERKLTKRFDLEYVGPISGLDDRPISTNLSDLRACRAFAISLGEGWEVDASEGSLLVYEAEQDFVIVLRPA